MIFKNAIVVDPTSTYHQKKVDFSIENGVFASIQNSIEPKEQNYIDLEGAFISPGWFDFRVHFKTPGEEHTQGLISGIKTALSAGFTGVGLSSSTRPALDTAAFINFIAHNTLDTPLEVKAYGSISKGQEGKEMAELYDMHNAGVLGYYDGVIGVQDPEALRKSLEYVSTFDGLIVQQANDVLVSKQHFARDLEILEYTGGRLHFSSVSTAQGVQLIKQAKDKGALVTCDVSIHHLIFDDRFLGTFDTNLKVFPPFGSEKNKKALIKAVNEGVIDIVCSNHMPVPEESKKVEFESAEQGISGLDFFNEAYQQYLSGVISLSKWVEVISINPRKIARVVIPKIELGADANFTSFEAENLFIATPEKMYSKAKNSPFVGKELRGDVKGVFIKGRWITR